MGVAHLSEVTFEIVTPPAMLVTPPDDNAIGASPATDASALPAERTELPS